jgi:hypothetical protein
MRNQQLKHDQTIYRYDSDRLDYVKVNTLQFISRSRTAIVVLVIAFSLMSILSVGLKPSFESKTIEQFTEPELIMIYEKANEFSEAKLRKMLKDLNVKHADIVLAQAKLETGNFTSVVFRNNHNLFGMREARSRISTNRGTDLGHAVYKNWNESVIDYALYQATYLHKLNREQYWQYLSQNYATAPNYVQQLKKLVIKINKKSKNAKIKR